MSKSKNYKFLPVLLSLFCATGCSFGAEPEHEIISVPEQTTYPEPETQKATFPPTETVPMTEPVSEPEQELSEMLYDALSQYQESICLDIPVDPDELAEVMNQLERDHPEIFWINGYSMQYNSRSAEITFQIIDQYTPDQLRKMADELERTVQEILRNIDQNASDYEKILQVHDYLVEITEYDSVSAAALSNQKNISNSAYGCLIHHKAVCQGYAQAFQLLLNRLGIECGICSGVARNEPHAWNYVLLNQNYYWVDVTWDDPVKNTEESKFPDDWVHHNYFLLDDAMLNRSRSFGDENLFIPVCDSLEENYFVRNQNYLDSYEFEEINRRLTENSSSGRLEVMFCTEEAYQACLQDLFYESHIWDMDLFLEKGGQIHYQQDPDLYILRFLFTTN